MKAIYYFNGSLDVFSFEGLNPLVVESGLDIVKQPGERNKCENREKYDRDEKAECKANK